MNISRTVVAIGLDHDRLCAVGATVGSDGVRIKGWAVASMPSGVDVKDARAVGEWIGHELDRAKLSKGKLLFAVPRGEVVLKRLRLPKGEGVGETELAGMVRLQMTRQLTMAIEGTAIDYVPVGEGGASTTAEPAGGTGTSVMAAALPGDRTAWYETVAEAAGGKIERLGLSSAGVAALLAGVSQRHAGPIMGVSVGSRAVEFVMVEDGQFGFARAADLGGGAEGDVSLVQRVAVEAKRTWMSYRVGEGSAEVDAVVIAGEGPLASEVGKKCGEALEMPWEVAGAPAGIQMPAEMPEADRLMAAPLLGLLTEEASGRPTLDFAHPRKPPDLAAARRQRVLAAAGILIIAAGGAYVWSTIQLSQLKHRLDDSVNKGGMLKTEYSEYLKDHARLSDFEQWSGAKVDWIAHVRWLTEQMPDPRQALMDGISGQMTAGVSQTPKDEWYDKNGWALVQQATFSLQGHTKQADIARDLRERLLAPQIYQVDTKGADTPDQFSYTLVTNRVAPGEGEEAAPAKHTGGSKKGGGK